VLPSAAVLFTHLGRHQSSVDQPDTSAISVRSERYLDRTRAGRDSLVGFPAEGEDDA
jgi:hypothetical protein